MPCLPRGGAYLCTKDGGVCSIRIYRQLTQNGEVAVAPNEMGRLVTTCPCRFEQNNLTVSWVGQEILNDPNPLVVKEVGFLEREQGNIDEVTSDISKEDVGRIDSVLVCPECNPLRWCALEMQAVYFSGPAMSHDFKAIGEHTGTDIPFPTRLRRPDYRSSGPKRLMPQLQIKVPTLRRWGKKMAVVVDSSFFASLGRMDSVAHISNADIAWFVVDYDESDREAVLKRGGLHLTTLERAVEGLTAGHPVSLDVFEARIKDKVSKHKDTTPTTTDHD